MRDHRARFLAFDGDVLAFICASAAQTPFLEDGFATIQANATEGEAIMQNMIAKLTHELRGELEAERIFFLTDPAANWRAKVDPTYKDNRKGLMKPLLLDHLKEYLRTGYGAVHWDTLEADDVLGIFATSEPWGDVLVIGRDKDFAQIPGLHHQIGKLELDGSLLITEITESEADSFFYTQVLAGDRVDGYAGCPGLGMKRAAAIVSSPVLLVPTKGIITRGKRKGQPVTKYVSEPCGDIWASIVSHYEAKGLTQEDALRNARLARILRKGDLHASGEVRLWVPPVWEAPGRRTASFPMSTASPSPTKAS